MSTMASAFISPLTEAEPYEQAVSNSSRAKTADPDELRAFYSDMERQEALQRRLSRDKSRSVWGRRNSKRGTAHNGAANLALEKFPKPLVPPLTLPPQMPTAHNTVEDNKEHLDNLRDQNNSVTNLQLLQRSIIPDPLGELPTWFSKESERLASSLTSHRIRYPIHNPVGPRWYQNQHLIPPSQRDAGKRPPTLFSPSFPPMPSQDSKTGKPPSRTPSGSNLDPSQNGNPPRPRKVSQTAVEKMDVTDPWGGNFSNPSPYDLRTSPSTTTPNTSLHTPATRSPIQTPPGTQSAQSAQSTQSGNNNGNGSQSRHKTVTPSPLSQSTSAVHLKPPEGDQTIPFRNLSKRRRRISDLFGMKSPPSFVGNQNISRGVYPSPDGRIGQLRHSNTVNASLISFSGEKKRSSILVRIARKLSLIRKPDAFSQSAGAVDQEDWHRIGASNSSMTNGDASHASSSDPVSSSSVADPGPSPRPNNEKGKQPNPEDMLSLASGSITDKTYSIGRLVVSNPDSESTVDTPLARNATLLPESSPNPPPDPHPRESGAPPASQIEILAPLPERPHHSRGYSQNSIQISTSSSLTNTLQSEHSAHPSSPESAYSSTEPSLQVPLGMPVGTSFTGHLAVPGPVDGPSQVPPIGPNGKLSIYDPSLEELATAASSYVDDPSLWRASMVANPPTPAVEAQMRLASNSPTLSTSPDPNEPPPMMRQRSTDEVIVRRPSLVKGPRDGRSPTSKHPETKRHSDTIRSPDASRQTETFKLVQSPSGSARHSGRSFAAAGEQWDVIETREGDQRRSKVRDRDNHRDSHRDSHRSSRTREHDVNYHWDSKKQDRSKADADARHSLDSTPQMVNGKHSNHRSSAHDGQHRSSKSESLGLEPKPHKRSSADVNKPTPPLPPLTPEPDPEVRLRRQSTSATRPTSELPPSAELNAIRARDAWEMNRLYKGRSMHYGAETNGILSSPAPVVATILPVNSQVYDHNKDAGSGHGSTYTSYAVQNAFQPTPGVGGPQYQHSYTLMPPHSIVYSPAQQSSHLSYYSAPSSQLPSTPSSQLQSTPAQSYPNTYHRIPSSASIPSIDSLPSDVPSRPTRGNPLPQPPRESPYEPPPFPKMIKDVNSVTRSGEYWTKYNGVATAHS